MKADATTYSSHNPYNEVHRVSRLRENLTSGSEGEGLETGNIAPRQSFTRQRVFRDVKSLLETRPIYHQRDENIRGHVFCSFLALVLRKELEGRLNDAGHLFEWSEIKQDLDALQRVTILEQGKRFAIRTQCQGNCGKIFQAVGVAPPPTIREIR